MVFCKVKSLRENINFKHNICRYKNAITFESKDILVEYVMVSKNVFYRKR